MKNFYKKIITTFGVLFTFFYQNLTIKSVEVAEFLKDKLPEVSTGESNSEDVIASIVVYLIGIVGILAIISITWAAIMMFLSVGDETKFNKAKKILIMSLIGVGIAGGGYTMVTIISRFSIS